MSEKIEETLVDLNIRIDRLRILYEQYFIGLEKAEPSVPRKEIVRIFAELQQTQIRNTALRFRHKSLMQRWNSYVMRWGRTLREIELGVYTRHVARAQRRGIQVPDEIVNRKPGASTRGKSNPEALAAAHQTLQGVLRAARDTQVLPPTRTEPIPSIEREMVDRDTLDGLLQEVDDGGDFIFDSRPKVVGGPPREAQSLSTLLPPPREEPARKTPSPPREEPAQKTPLPKVLPLEGHPSVLQAVRAGPVRNTPAPVSDGGRRPGDIITPPPMPIVTRPATAAAGPPPGDIITPPPTLLGAPPRERSVTPPPFPVDAHLRPRERSITPPPIPSVAPRAPKLPDAPRERSVTPPPFPAIAPRAPKLPDGPRERSVTPPPFPLDVHARPRERSITPPPFPSPVPRAVKPPEPQRPRSVTPPPLPGEPPRAPRERSITPPPFPSPVPRAVRPPEPQRPRTVTPPPISGDPPRAPRPPAPREVLPGMSEGEMRALHQRYAAARKTTDGTDVGYDALVSSLKKQVPGLLEKHKCAGVTFDLTVRDNQVILKAKPKK